MATPGRGTAPIFLVLRRMRTPLILLILIFAVTTLGLTLTPGENGRRLSIFDAFYVMSYTASTIGFGELPEPFSYAQRLWVTASIYLTVLGWAYAIGTLLSLLQDRAFRGALAAERFGRKVRRLREPFVLIAGYGATGERLGRAWDQLGRSFVAVDILDERIDSLDVEPYSADVPGLVADAADPGRLEAAGLHSRYCQAVVALTNDDKANLAVTMSAALLRPDLPVIARTLSPQVSDRMSAFGTPTIVNPFDRFGDHLRLALRAPVAHRLYTWVEAGPGADLPELNRPPRDGAWVICGFGRFGRELVADLRAEGLRLVVVDADPGLAEDEALAGARLVTGDASEPEVMAEADLDAAVGFVAGTDDDTTNLSLVAAARRHNRRLYTAARQNQPENAPLFRAMDVDLVLVPSESVAREVYARLSTPLAWRFLQQVARHGDPEAEPLLADLGARCGRQMQQLWKLTLTPAEVPALIPWLESGRATLGDLLRDPDEREQRLRVVPLLLAHGRRQVLGPAGDAPLAAGDELLLASPAAARRELLTTATSGSTAAYVTTGVRVPEAWLWRRLSRTRSAR